MDRTVRWFCLICIIFTFLWGGMQMVKATGFDSVGFGGQVTLYPDNNITNISLYAPAPNGTTGVWFDATEGHMQIRINLNATQGKTYWVDFYNKTDGGYTKIGSTSSAHVTNPRLYSYIWTNLSESSIYNWSVNVTCNATSEYLNQSGFYSFTTPTPLTVFDSIGFGGQVNLTGEDAPGGVVFDSIGFGGLVNLSVGVGGNWSNNSGYFEFYKRTYLYDLNLDGNNNTGDRTAVWANRDSLVAYNYYYDVNSDSNVNVGDRTAVWGNRD